MSNALINLKSAIQNQKSTQDLFQKSPGMALLDFGLNRVAGPYDTLIKLLLTPVQGSSSEDATLQTLCTVNPTYIGTPACTEYATSQMKIVGPVK